MTRSNRIWQPWPILLGLVLAAGVAGCGSDEPPAKAAGDRMQGPPPVSVLLGNVTERSIRPEIRVIGTVEPNRQTTVSAEVSGLVERFDLREGDRVVKDRTVIARLDRTDREIALRQAAAARARARAELEKLQRGRRPEEISQRRAEVRERQALMEQAQKDLSRAKDLHADGAISIQQLQPEEANLPVDSLEPYPVAFCEGDPWNSTTQGDVGLPSSRFNSRTSSEVPSPSYLPVWRRMRGWVIALPHERATKGRTRVKPVWF